jgi:hypothetical protein
MPFLSERRIHPRYAVQKIVSYRYKHKKYLTLTLNVGLGGIQIKTHCGLPEGEHLDLEFVLGSTSIRLKGRTVYSESLPGGQRVSGVQFTGMSYQGHSMLRGYLSILEK